MPPRSTTSWPRPAPISSSSPLACWRNASRVAVQDSRAPAAPGSGAARWKRSEGLQPRVTSRIARALPVGVRPARLRRRCTVATAHRFGGPPFPSPAARRQLPRHDRPTRHPAERSAALSSRGRICRAGTGNGGDICRDAAHRPARLLGGPRRRTRMVSALADGAGVETAARAVVHRRNAQRVGELPRSARARRETQPGGADLGRRAGRPPGAHLLGAVPRGRAARPMPCARSA